MVIADDDTPERDARPPIRGVTVIGDFLRPDGRGRPGAVDRLVGWLCNACKRQIGLAAGLPVTALSTVALPGLADWLSVMRPAAEADAFWAAAFARLPCRQEWTEAIDRLIVRHLRGRFCVGYELPPYLVNLLDAHGVPYIDIRLHPVRFMDDLLFAVRASEAATRAFLASVAVAEGEVIATAGLREAMCQLLADAVVPPDTLLVLGQRRYDATQIVDDRFFDAGDHRADIAAICGRHRAVVLKAHPLDPDHSLLDVAQHVAPNLFGPAGGGGMVGDNLYRLLAMPEIVSVLTVSSSAAYEARYFDKTVYTLGCLPVRLGWRGAAPDAATHVSLDDVVLSVDFWRHVLAPHTPVSACDGMRLAPKPNRLRIALDSFWNFNEIDTDRVPRRAA